MKTSAATYRFGQFTLDTGDHCLFSEGQEVYLRPKTYDTLLYLLQHPGRLVTKNELLDAVWADVEVTENVLSQCIKEVRAALRDDVQNPQFLKTLPRLGYEFIANVESAGEPVTEELVEEELRAVRVLTAEDVADFAQREREVSERVTNLPVPSEVPAVHAPGKTQLAVRWLLAITFLLVAIVFAMRFGGLRQRLFGHASSPRISSLAVLPLQNLTGDPQQEFFADGMTEELITTLGKLKALRVISRTSVMRYKKSNKPLPQIAKELNVDAVIEGAVLRSGNRVRITAQLIQASTDKHLWAETYDGDLRDVLALQSDVARAITTEIKAELTPQERERLAGHRPVDPEAYALYLQGKVLQSRDNGPDNRSAIAVLERSVALDPNFAPAYASLGRAYADRLFGWEPKDEWKEKAEAAIDKALALDAMLAEAHVSRAALLFTPAHGWQYERAIQESKTALALDPNLAEGHVVLGMVYFHTGLLEEAREEFQSAAAINPTLPDPPLYIGFTFMFGGQCQEALPFLRAFPDATFSHTLEALCLWELGQKEESWKLARELLKADPQEKFVYLAAVHTLLLADGGKSQEAEKRIKDKILKEGEALKPYGHFHHIANLIADIYAQLNKPEEAVPWLELTAETGFPCYPFFERDRALDPIRQDPRFIAFLQSQKRKWEYLRSTYGYVRASSAVH